MKTRTKIASVILMAAAAIGTYNSELTWKKENYSFIQPYANTDSIRNAHILNWIRNFPESSVQDSSDKIAHHIISQGYIPLEANSRPEDAKLIILTDLHRVMDNNLDRVLIPHNGEIKGIVGKNDKILFEGMQQGTKYDFRDSECLNEKLTQLECATNDLKHLKKKLEAAEIFRPENGGYGRWLAANGYATFTGIEAPEEIKIQHMYSLVQGQILVSTLNNILEGYELHPFQEWMLYEDLKIVDKNKPVEEQVEPISENLEHVLSKELSIRKERQEEMNNNIIREVQDLEPHARAYLIVGANHLAGAKPYLNEALQEKRIPYFAFGPDLKKIAMTDSMKIEKSHDYLIEDILPWYMRERIERENVIPYKGGFDGLAEKL